MKRVATLLLPFGFAMASLAFFSTGTPVAAVSPCDPATNPETVKEVTEAVSKAKEILDLAKKLGLPPPKGLEKFAKNANEVLLTGADLGKAMGQAAFEIEDFMAKNLKACETAMDPPVCEAERFHNDYWRRMQAINLNNPGNMFRRFAGNFAARHMGVKCPDPAPAATPASPLPRGKPVVLPPGPPVLPDPRPYVRPGPGATLPPVRPSAARPGVPGAAATPAPVSGPGYSPLPVKAAPPPVPDTHNEYADGSRRNLDGGGMQPGGIRINITPEGRDGDLSDVRERVLRLLPRKE